MPQDNEKLGLLYDALKNDEVFSQVIPSDAVAFAKEYSSPDKMRTLYDAIKADEIFKDAVPNTFEETIQEFGLGKPLVEPTKSGGSGSATKRTPQNIELQSQFPTNLQADQTQELIESNIQGAELAGLDYESISKQMAGRPPINFLFDQVNKIQDPEEKFKTKRSFYKIAINNISDANTNIRGNVEQMKQGMLQMQEQYEQGLNQYNEYLQQGDKETANLLAQDLNQQQENIKLAATQYEDLVKEYNYNAEFLGILNAGRAASFNKAKDEGLIRTGKLPIGAAMFSNMIGGTTIQFSPEETMAASAWNAITPNLVRTLASGIEIADYFVRPGSLESTNLSKMAGDALLDFANDIEVETEKFVPKDTELNIFKELNPYSAGQFAGSLIGSVAGGIGSGGLAGTGKAAMVFNAAQGYGGMYGWGKEAGLSSAEASALAAPVGLVYGYLGDKGVESLASVVGRESFKKIVLKGIKELGKDKTPKALSEVFLKSLQEFGKNTVKGAAKESLQEGVEFSSEFGMKVLASETGLAKTEDDLTFEAFMSGLEDSMKGGALGGGLLGGLLGASPRRTLATVVSESVNDPIKEQEFMDNMNALLNGTQIDQQQYDEVMQMYNRAKEVNNTVPSNVTNEQARAEAIDLIQERNDLQAQVEVIDPAMAKPFNDRIASIDQRLGEISEGKSITQPEDIQQQKEGMTEIVQPETPVETVDLTPQETPVQSTETIEQPKAEVAENPALRDVENTAKALKMQETAKTTIDLANLLNIEFTEGVEEKISEAYHKAKADGSNPELVKAVESLLSKEQEAQGQQEVETLTPTKNEEGTIEERPDQEVLLEGVQETRDENEVGQVGEQLRTEETIQEEITPKTNTINGYKFTKTPSLTEEDGLIVEEIPSSDAKFIPQQIFLTDKRKSLKEGVINEGGGWYSFDANTSGGKILYNDNTGEAVILDHTKGGRMAIVISDFVKNNNRVEQPRIIQEEVDPFAALEQVANELEKAAQDEAKKKSFSSQMNNIVDRIDKLIDDIDNSNIALSSIPFARQIARTALKIFRDAFDAAGRTPEAFRKAMQEMRDALSRDADYKNLDRQQQAELIKDLSNEILDKNPFNFQGDERVSKFASRVSKIYANVNDVYTSQSQEKVRQEVIALIDELGLDVVLEYAESAGVPSGVKTAILGEAFGRAKAAFDANPTPENRKAFNEATERLKQWGTDAGQGVAYFNKIYELFPELQVEQFQEDLNKQTEDNLGNQGKKKVERIKQETVRIKKDLFNALSNVLNGKLDAIELFSRNILSDERLKKGISKLVNIAGKLNDSDKKKMSELFERLRNSGKLELENTIKEVRPLIYEGLKSINPSLQTTLSEQQISDIADEFAKVYEDIATNMLTDFINREFQDSKKSGQQEKNGKVARLILQGVLDNPSTLNAFAQKFGIPSITPQQASQLRTLAQRVNQSKGGQKAAAQRQLTIYINGLKKAANSVFARQMQRVGDATNDLGSLIINNILFGVTAGFAYISNLTRTIGAAIGSLVKGEPDAIKFALKEGMNQQFTLPNGQVIDLKLRPVRDAILAATSGIPRLSEYLLAGISDQEMKIRQAKTRTERIARRIFLTASMRLYSAVDASVVPYYKAMTKYSIMKKLILQMYKDNKQPKPSKVDLDKQVRGLIGLDVTNFDAIVERAYENTMNSTLVDDLVAQGAWNKNNPMPDASSRNNPNSAAAQVYNEFITNIYELHESDFYNRFLELQNSKDNLGNDIFDTGKAGMYARMLKDVDRILAKNTNEMAFYGRPSGFEGQMYDVLISINNKVPGLKYSGYSPLFVGAAMNGAAYARKTYPVVNAISYAYYKAAGKRISDFGNDGEFETDFGLKVDQNNMLQTVVSSTIAMAGIAAWLFSRYDTPEEEEQALKDRNWSGYVNDLNFAQSQSFFDRNGNKLQKGFLYINGYPAMPVYRLPFFGMFEAAGFLKNYGTLTQSKKSEDLFKDEEEEERYKGVLGAYLLNGYLLSLRLSQTKELSESITKILSATPDDLGGSTSEKVQKDFENKMSRLAANLIPFNQAQRQIADLFVNAEGGYNRKVASTFAEKIAMQTAFQHWMVKSNMVDPFGRPIPEVFDVRGLTLGFNMFEFDKNGNIYTFLDKAYAGDKYMKLHLDKEYVYTSNHTKIIPVTVELEGEGIDVPAAKKIVKELKESGVEAQLPEKAMGTLTTDEVKYYTYNMELDDDEINIMNEEAAKQVKKLVDEPGNYQVLSNPELTKRAYRQFMDKAYKYSTTLQVYKMHSKELGEAYLNTVKKQYKNLQNDPIVKELGLVIPSGWSID
jgi:hypothetical protein